jgi:Acyl dehydratase
MDRDGGYDPPTPIGEFASAWARSSRQVSRGIGQMYRSIARANRAFVPGLDQDAGAGTTDGDEVAFGRPGWETERSVDHWEDLGVGDHVRFSKEITDEDVVTFAGVSGDTNRLHLDDEFAAETRFGNRIAHGTLVSGLISAALARLPGLTIYLSQTWSFSSPSTSGTVSPPSSRSWRTSATAGTGSRPSSRTRQETPSSTARPSSSSTSRRRTTSRSQTGSNR